jgi:hypothetical protein
VLVDAAVQAALLVAAGLDVYEVAPVRGNGPKLIEPGASGTGALASEA